MIIESHAHYSHKRYDGTFRYLTGQLTAEKGNRDGLLKRLRESGVALCIEPAIDFDSNRLTAALYRQHPDFFRLAVGVHPTRTAQVPWRQRKQLATWARGPGVAAIGETGLDYHRPRHHRLVQLLWFRYQLDLARRTGLPLVLHIRMADRDALPMLRRRRRWLPGGVVHCFQGGWEPGPGPVSGHRRCAAAAGVGPPAGDSGPGAAGAAAGGDRQPLCAAGHSLGGQQKISGQGAQLLPAAAPDH